MSWEKRSNYGPYYTRSKTINGRTIRQYFGRGQCGVAAAAEDEARRKAEKEHQEHLAAERKRMQRLETPSLALDSLVQAAINMELTNAGYYLRRREWRKKTT